MGEATPPRPYIIGVAGGTGSGKTTVSKGIRTMMSKEPVSKEPVSKEPVSKEPVSKEPVRKEPVGKEHLAYIQHDSYYHDLSHMPPAERARRNYDHPQSLDTPLLIEHLRLLHAGHPAPIPIYDFATHTRRTETQLVQPAHIVLLEGILIFVEKELRDLMDMRIFVDTDADLRFIRRMQRDIEERGRSTESVIEQYLATVRPMHLEFVEPSKRYADIIVPEGGYNRVAMEMIVSRIRAVLQE